LPKQGVGVEKYHGKHGHTRKEWREEEMHLLIMKVSKSEEYFFVFH